MIPSARETSDSSTALFPSFVDAVLFHATREPGAPAIGTEAGILTFGQLADAIRAATVRCASIGLKPGSLVAVMAIDPIWHICLICALYRIGVASVSASAQEVPVLPTLGTAAVLYDRDPPTGFAGPCHRVTPDWFAPSASAAPPLHVFGANNLCRVALSSGTTGLPKPIAMSPQIIWDRLTTYLFRGSFSSSERVYCGPQLQSHFGFAVAFAALAYGKMVSFAQTPEAVFPLLSYFKVDLAILAVFQLSVMAEHPLARAGGFGSLREIQAGGALISDALLQRSRAVFPARLVNAYASTEAGTAATAPVEWLGEARKQGAVGFIVPWASVDVCDDEERVLPKGSDGNIRVRSLGLAPTYQPGMTQVVPPLHFFPGDYGRVMPDNMLVIAGRATELINIGGNKIAPEFFESVLLQCPGVKDAAVFTVDINSTLPQTWAAIVAEPSVNIADVLKKCAATPLIGTPGVVRIVSAIPRNSTGKIMRDQLRKELTRSGS
jgi:acyl-coenzyme A synthetase/AMP-(fatty) acid ligase